MNTNEDVNKATVVLAMEMCVLRYNNVQMELPTIMRLDSGSKNEYPTVSLDEQNTDEISSMFCVCTHPLTVVHFMK